MNRREFLNSALATTLVGGAVANRASAQQGRFPAGPPRPYPGTTREIPLHASSRYLHWLRTPGDVAKACLEISCRSLMVTVQDAPSAHVQLANVATQLPTFVKALRSAGVDVKMVRGGDQTQVDAGVERLVGTMGQLGITHYVLGTEQYDLAKPLMPQLDAIKRKVDVFAKLNMKHGTTLLYDTRAGANIVGAGVWDLLRVFEGFDPKQVGFHWDTGQMSLHGPMWESMFRAAGPYLAAISWADTKWKQELGALIIEGGEFPGALDAGDDDADDVFPAARGAGAGGRAGGAAAAGAGWRRWPRGRCRGGWPCGWGCVPVAARVVPRVRQAPPADVAVAAVAAAPRPAIRWTEFPGRWQVGTLPGAWDGAPSRQRWARVSSTSSATEKCWARWALPAS